MQNRNKISHIYDQPKPEWKLFCQAAWKHKTKVKTKIIYFLYYKIEKEKNKKWKRKKRIVKQ